MTDKLFKKIVKNRNQWHITYKDLTKTLREWSVEYAIDPKTLRDRILTSEWSIHKALTYSTPEYRELHGMRYSISYTTWNEMKRRCYQLQYEGYKNYGGRGIRVCNRWRNSFLAFIEDMGERPNRSMTIERINNNLGYYASNCKWATKAEQSRNTRKNINFTYEGISMCRYDWELKAGLPKGAILNRMNRGWTFKESYLTPLGSMKIKYITYKGITLSRTAWNKKAGLPKRLIAKRMDRGWTFEEAYLTPYCELKGTGY